MDTFLHHPPALAHVLLVEDEESIRAMLAEEFSSHGLIVTEAADADEAWNILEAGAGVDLVFSDIRMPGSMNGTELMRRVRRNFPHIKRVLTSGNPGPDNMPELGRFLQKPYRLETAARMALDVLGLPCA
ncbi:MAG: response regulator [Acidocella sp.]